MAQFKIFLSYAHSLQWPWRYILLFHYQLTLILVERSLIGSRRFVSEQHFVITEDGYILGFYRIINPHVKQSQRKDLKPIFLQHGPLGSGADFQMNAPGGDAPPCTAIKRRAIRALCNVIQ